MISYNPKDWALFLFRFHKSDTLRKLLPLMLAIGVYSWLVAFLINGYIPANSNLKNISLIHTLLGFAISMLLVFRTNTAYDRWWEGRRLWGALVNNSRNLALKLNSMLTHDHENRLFFKQLIPRFAMELKIHLQKEETRFLLDEKAHPEIPDFDRGKHVPTQVAGLLISRINMMYNKKQITGEQLILLNNEISSFMDICGACERIKNTPIPYSYSAFIKKFIFIYVITLPLGYVFNMGYLIIPVVMFIFFVLASLEIIAEEIEDPFGKDTNDLPMQRIAENIKKNVAEILT
jgi:putative membrane protein